MKTRGNGSGSGEDRMRTLLRDLLRYSTTSAILEGQPTLDRTRVPRSCRLTTKLISLLSAAVATWHMKPVPEGAQNFWEWLVEGLYTFLEGIIGSHLVQRTFWFFATVFIFILAANWEGLIPGVGTIGWGHRGLHGFRIDQPLF